MKFRAMVAADLPDIHHIDITAFPDPWEIEQHEEELGRTWSKGLVAVDELDHAIGYLRYWLVADEMQILNVAVHETWRKQGVASALLRRGIDDARVLGANEATLEMRRSNTAARGCYESLGFQVVGQRANYYGDEDAILLTLNWESGTGATSPIRGLYVILDDTFIHLNDMPTMAKRLADIGCSLFQLRCKQMGAKPILTALDQTRDALAGYGARLLVNDRPDLAVMANVDGVHVGQTDVPPHVARKIVGKNAIVGYSTHTMEQLDAGRAEPADYLGFGPVFPTTTKADADPIVGLDTLALVCSQTALPVVAIGGITARNLPATRVAGASAFAIISAIWTAPDPVIAAETLLRIWGEAAP